MNKSNNKRKSKMNNLDVSMFNISSIYNRNNKIDTGKEVKLGKSDKMTKETQDKSDKISKLNNLNQYMSSITTKFESDNVTKMTKDKNYKEQN